MPSTTGYKTDQVGAYIVKDPASVLDYTLDWTDWLKTGDTVTGNTVTVETISGDSSPLALDSSSFTTTTTTAYLSGGTAGNIYNISYTITTDDGLTDSRNFRIKVLERQL